MILQQIHSGNYTYHLSSKSPEFTEDITKSILVSAYSRPVDHTQ